jgi:putative ABC transport system substrate-binding protein
VKRREFITLLGGAAAAWPLAARAQQSARLQTIGFLGPNTHSVASEWLAAFVQRLRELGWIEGRTVAIEYRWAEGRKERGAYAIQALRVRHRRKFAQYDVNSDRAYAAAGRSSRWSKMPRALP